MPSVLERTQSCVLNSPLTSLIHLILSNNQLVGILPEWLGQLENLVELELSYNLLEGHVPASIGTLVYLTDVGLGGNRLNGTLPESFGQLSEATIFDTPTAATQETLAAPIDIKLDDTNYRLWSQVVEMYISGKDKLGHINGDLPQPQEADPTFKKWRTENAVVKSWLINSMDPKLIGNYIRFPKAKAIWDAIATTYFDGVDTSQVYDLNEK
ncbi:hypothetical protein RJ640_027748 [Escallonia rubra]|uniref:Retrotransposon Copia-like N-terminal domain-containing protein n=1 Tax=Escallonia rubra TaxID=112253 RepID=A0AA88U0S5_9ASTE|nr:hypothetical protein RJ640_027748 [Escallonia rubra]